MSKLITCTTGYWLHRTGHVQLKVIGPLGRGFYRCENKAWWFTSGTIVYDLCHLRIRRPIIIITAARWTKQIITFGQPILILAKLVWVTVKNGSNKFEAWSKPKASNFLWLLTIFSIFASHVLTSSGFLVRVKYILFFDFSITNGKKLRISMACTRGKIQARY